jgi:beta-galactosidase
VLGDFVWTSLDYIGESGIGRMRDAASTEFLGEYPWHHANCGDLDLCGFKRPQSYYRDIVWDAGTRLYIAVHPPEEAGHERVPSLWGWHDIWPNWNWQGHEGQPLKVEVYSAFEEVELFLNDRSLGRLPTGRAQRHIASFQVPYEPGQLKAVGYQSGGAASEMLLVTAGPAARICLSPDRAAIRADAQDLAYITVEVADAAGQVHPADDRLVRFSVDGPGELAAVGSGNPVSEEDYRGDRRTTFRGRSLVIVKSTGEPGTVTLRAEADGLEPAVVEIRATAS